MAPSPFCPGRHARTIAIHARTRFDALTRHRLGPVVAASVGFALALGFAAAHWLPHWSALSDPVWPIRSATWFSYIASSVEIAGAFAVGFAGLAVLRADAPRISP